MDHAHPYTDTRIPCWDMLRWLLVLCVVVEHASHAYNGQLWWPVLDTGISRLAGWLSALSDAFAMPLLFFIAGYFALPSITRAGVRSFIKRKLWRLGIPWLVCILTVCPLLPLLYHFTRNGLRLTASYLDLWVALLRDAAALKVGLVVSMNDLMRNNHFYQRYMWFLSLLLLFFLLFSLLYAVRRRWFTVITALAHSPNPASASALRLFFGLGTLTAFCSFATVGLMLTYGPPGTPPEPLFTLGGLIQFRPSRFFLYLIYFALGVVTYRNRWIERGLFPGPLGVWVPIWSSLLVIYLLLHHQLHHGPTHLEEVFGMLFFLVLNYLTIASLGLFTAVGLAYANRPSPISTRITAHAYEIYLSHYPIVLGMQLIFLMLPGIPAGVKFFVVSLLSISGAYLISRWLIKPHPRLTVLALVMIWVAMVGWL